MKVDLKQRLQAAAAKDPDVVCSREKLGDTLGNNPEYLLDVFGITKGDLIRLERKGLAIKARYETKQGHRTRWLILDDAIQAG